MSVKQTLLDFKCCEGIFTDEVVRNRVFELLRQQGAKGPIVSSDLDEGKGFFFMFLGPDDGHWILRSFPSGLVTLDVAQYMQEDGEQPMSTEKLKSLKASLGSLLSAGSSFILPPIRRGCKLNPYHPTSDNRLIEYDFDKIVYEKDSPYQNIKIKHSKEFGNVLILDDDVNLAESDILYTRAITGNGRENYKDKTVLILGGGDGGILHELLKESPKFVTMIEIDQLVIDGAVKFLRGICQDSMDSLSGDNYKVIVGDCVKAMEEYIAEGRMFDYVINDLTAIPISTSPVGSLWDFMRQILDLSFKVLSPSGKYFTQGNGYNNQRCLDMYEEQLAKMSCPVEFSKETVYVPSYLEAWIFYEIWKKNNSNS